MSERVCCVKCAADESIAEEDQCALTRAELLTIDGMTVISVCPDCNHKFSAHHVDGKVIQQAGTSLLSCFVRHATRNTCFVRVLLCSSCLLLLAPRVYV
jgi:hypothetical protein